jgi:hypothetical protein
MRIKRIKSLNIHFEANYFSLHIRVQNTFALNRIWKAHPTLIMYLDNPLWQAVSVCCAERTNENIANAKCDIKVNIFYGQSWFNPAVGRAKCISEQNPKYLYICKQLFTVLFTSKSTRPLVSKPLSDFEEILFSFTRMSIWRVWVLGR